MKPLCTSLSVFRLRDDDTCLEAENCICLLSSHTENQGSPREPELRAESIVTPINICPYQWSWPDSFIGGSPPTPSPSCLLSPCISVPVYQELNSQLEVCWTQLSRGSEFSWSSCLPVGYSLIHFIRGAHTCTSPSFLLSSLGWNMLKDIILTVLPDLSSSPEGNKPSAACRWLYQLHQEVVGKQQQGHGEAHVGAEVCHEQLCRVFLMQKVNFLWSVVCCWFFFVCFLSVGTS